MTAGVGQLADDAVTRTWRRPMATRDSRSTAASQATAHAGKPIRTRFLLGKRGEQFVFALLGVLIWPFVAVGVVGGYGFLVWMYQLMTGPPGPPGG
jgi:nitrate reductase NapE